MADESTILSYIIRAQDQAKALLQGQLSQLSNLTKEVQRQTQEQQKASRATQDTVRGYQQQGDALDKLIQKQNQFAQQNQRTIQGLTAVNSILQAGTTVNAQQAGAINALNTAVQRNSDFMHQNGAEWNTLIAQMKFGSQLTPQVVAQFGQLGSQFINVTTQSAQATKAYQQQSNALEQLAQQQQRVAQSNSKTLAGFNVVGQSLQVGRPVDTQQAEAFKLLNAEVQKNSAFIQQNVTAWISLLSQMRVGGQVTAQNIQQFANLSKQYELLINETSQFTKALVPQANALEQLIQKEQQLAQQSAR